MSVRVDIESLIPGAVVCGNVGLGVLGSEIPSSGDQGAGFVYADLSLPADASKEIRGLITTWPTAGTLFANEDTSFTFDAPDGSYSFTYSLFVDGVNVGSATALLTVGDGLAYVSNGQSITYSVQSYVTQSQAVLYQVQSYVSANQLISYYVEQAQEAWPVSQTQEIAYQVLANVSQNQNISYVVRSTIIQLTPSALRTFSVEPESRVFAVQSESRGFTA